MRSFLSFSPVGGPGQMSPGPLTQQVFIPYSTVPTFPASLCGARVPEVTTPCVNLPRSSTKAPFPLLHCSACPGQLFESSFCLLPRCAFLYWDCLLLQELVIPCRSPTRWGAGFVPCQNCGASSSQRCSADGDGGSCLHAPFVLVYSSVAGR